MHVFVGVQSAGEILLCFFMRMPHAHIHTVTQLDAAQCNHSGGHWTGPGLGAGAATLSSQPQSGWRTSQCGGVSPARFVRLALKVDSTGCEVTR